MSGLQRGGRNLLRKRRKWPLSPYKAKWHETFNQRQAMESLINQIQSKPQPHLLLPTLISTFTLHHSLPTPSAYRFIIKTLATQPHNHTHTHHLSSVLDHLEHSAEFNTPEHLLVDVIKIYADVGLIEEAVDLFERMGNGKFRCKATAFSLNALLKVMCKRKEWNRFVPRVLMMGREMSVRIEDSSFRILVMGLCRIRKVKCAIELVSYMARDGGVVDGRMCSIILGSVWRDKELCVDDVMRFLDEVRWFGFVPDVTNGANVIRFLVRERKGKEALGVLKQMKADRIKPDVGCYTMVMDGVVAGDDFEKMEELFDEMLVLGLVPDVFTYNVYIKGLCKQKNKVEEGHEMLARMEKIGCSPDVNTYNLILAGCCRFGDIFRFKEIMKEMKHKGVQMDLRTHNIFLDGLVNCDDLSDAVNYLTWMLDNNLKPRLLTSENIMCGLLQKGLVYEGLHLFEKLLASAIVLGNEALEALISSLGHRQLSSEKDLIDLVNPV